MLSVDAGLVAKMHQPMPLGLVSCQLGTVNKAICHGVWGGDSGEKGFQELLQRTHRHNQGGGWKQGREVGLAGVG